MADVEAMFHQVRVRPEDCDALRFLWWPENDLNRQPEEYQMLVHLFGGVSSPTCANFALRRTADDNGKEFESEIINTVKHNFYVDDCFKSTENEPEAINTAEQLRLLLSKGGFRLTKWLSNSRKVIESVPELERYTVLLRNNLTENAFGSRLDRVRNAFLNAFHLRSIRVPFAFHSSSIRVPFAFHSRSIRVAIAFHLRSICVPLLPERICGTRSGYTRIETGDRWKSSRFPEY